MRNPTERESLCGAGGMTIQRHFPDDSRHIRLDQGSYQAVRRVAVSGMILAVSNYSTAFAMSLILRPESRVYRVMLLKYSC